MGQAKNLQQLSFIAVAGALFNLKRRKKSVVSWFIMFIVVALESTLGYHIVDFDSCDTITLIDRLTITTKRYIDK